MNLAPIHPDLNVHLEIRRTNYHSPKLYIQHNKPAYAEDLNEQIELTNEEFSKMSGVYSTIGTRKDKEKWMKNM